MTILLTPEALATRIIAVEDLIKQKDEAYRAANKVEAAALEIRIRQDIAREYAVKADLDKLRDKQSDTPSRIELLAAITVTSAVVSAVITILAKFLDNVK